jgi:hypothetical protein
MLIKRNFLLTHKNDSDFTLCRRGSDLLRHLSSGEKPAVTAVRLHEGGVELAPSTVGGNGRFVKFGTPPSKLCEINKHTRGIHFVDHAASESLDSGRVVGKPETGFEEING